MNRTHFIPVLAIAVTGVIASASRCSNHSAPDPAVAALGQILAGKALLSANDSTWDEVHEFYKLREGKPAWVTDKPTERTREAVHVLRAAREHGPSLGRKRLEDVRQNHQR